MSLKGLRVVVMTVCGAGIGGMVAGSIADNNGAAITSGLIATVAVLVLMAATVAARTTAPTQSSVDEGRAERIENRVKQLVETGAPEGALRALVADAVRLGRGS